MTDAAERLPVRGADFDAERSERALAALRRRIERRRQRTRRAAISVATAAMLSLLSVAGWQLGSLLSSPVAGDYRGPRTVTFIGGSSVRLLDAESQVNVVDVSDRAVVVELEHGGGHFKVEPQHGRRFVTRVGTVTVEVIGTSFTVTREDPRVHVAVEHGVVRVSWPGGSKVLGAASAGWFPPAEEATEPAPVARELDSVAPGESEEAAPASGKPEAPASAGALEKSARNEFLERHRARDFEAAYRMLERDPSIVQNTAQDLMLAADAARNSGRPAKAAEFLKRVTTEHASSAQAPLAAFTLGRLYLSQLGSPSLAFEAFGLARKLSPGGALGHDALVRQVEAADRAGAKERARELAEQYVRQYPSGRRLEAVRRHGGLSAEPAKQ